MALHLVGETIDRAKAHAAQVAGKLVSPWRGIYVDAADDVDRTILNHAVRIAAYLYPSAYLSGISAVALAPTSEGRLYLSGRRNQRTRIRALEIIQNEAPENASTIPVVVGDDMGEINLKASSPRQRFLEAFRQRSEHAAAIDSGARLQMADRLREEYGGDAGAADAVWALARANRWIREAERAEQYLQSPSVAAAPAVNKAGVILVAAWHGDVIGRLTHDGAEWRWTGVGGARPLLVRQTHPGSLPPFIESLLPEGWLAKILNEKDDRETLRSGSRYMSNMVVAAEPVDVASFPADVLRGRLAAFQKDGRFIGRYRGPERRTLEDSFQERLAGLFAIEGTPRLSGVQIKAPMSLTEAGDLVPATEMPFTHILKPAGTNGFEHLPLVEWGCLELARAAGFEVPSTALVDMPDGMEPALLVERFDIRRTDNETRRIALEDFCSVLDQPASRKYESTIEKVARGLRPLSTDAVADGETLLARALFAWLVADGDMHLKNLALLKIAEAGDTSFGSVRLAPVYDVVTTRVFPGLENDRMALKINGRDSKLVTEDFLSLARTMEVPRTRAMVLMADVARRTASALPGLEPPARSGAAAGALLDRVKRIVAERSEGFV